jgi:hypothetical protein
MACRSPTTPTKKGDQALLMLTDYAPAPAADHALIDLLRRRYSKLFYWPQGSEDLAYLRQLGSDVEIVPPGLDALKGFLGPRAGSLDYVGTRLHGGIFCIRHGIRSLVLSIDNRAAEIARDTGLPCAQRGDLDSIERWIGSTAPTRLTMPADNIEAWRRQFAHG